MQCQYQISPAEVSEAFDLRRKGHQRLRQDISTTEVSLFQLTLDLGNGNTAIVHIKVQPVQHNDYHHPFYAIRILYETSHPHLPVDDDFISKVQIVYDTYIQASRWKFDHECFKRCPELRPCGLCSKIPASFAERTCIGPRPSTVAYLPTPESLFEETPMQRVFDARPALSVSNDKPGESESVPDDGNAAKVVPVPGSGVKRAEPPGEIDAVGQKSKKRKAQTVDDVINALVAVILDGLKAIATEPLPVRGLEELADSILTQSAATATSEELDALLLKLAGEFAKNRKQLQQEAAITAWFNWYFSSCLHYLRLQMKAGKRDRQQDRSSLKVGVLHDIINRLLFTDGTAALSVIASLAARGHTLSAAARFSIDKRQIIGQTVAERIKGKLQGPNDFAIPNPIRYAAVIVQKNKEFTDLNTAAHDGDSFWQACQDLGLLNLAVLQSQITARDVRFLAATIRISDIQAHWASFEDATPHVKTYRRLLSLVEKASAESPLPEVEAAVASLESGNFQQTLESLERLGAKRSGSDVQIRPDTSTVTLLVRKVSSFLLSRFSSGVHDWLEVSRMEQDSISNGSIYGVRLETSIWQDEDGNAIFDSYNSTDRWGNEAQISDFDQLLNIDWTDS